jgi:hypothetical protein
LATAFTYQREDAKADDLLYSERIAGSARLQIDKASVDMELKYDLAGKNTNLARVRVTAPLGSGIRGSGEYRKYSPYFDLWTIWGAFSPVGYDEARARLDWVSATGNVSARAYGSYREYGDAEVSTSEEYAVEDHSWRMAAGGRISLTKNTSLDGEYRYDTGYGSRRSGGDLSVQRFFDRDTYLALRGTVFESFSEFTVGSGTVYGGGFQGSTSLGSAKVLAGAMFYKHIQNDRPSRLDLNQARLNLTVEIPFGEDPGLRGRGDQ